MMTPQDIVNELNARYAKKRSEDLFFGLEDLDSYWRIVERSTTHAGRSVYCFIAIEDKETKTLGVVRSGDILKPASFTQPAKHARGNIDYVTESNFSIYFSAYGVPYMK